MNHPNPSLMNDSSALIESSCLELLQENLRDLIIIAWEGYNKTPGSLLRLERFRYVYGEKLDDRYCTRCDVQVRAPEQNGTTMLTLTFIVEKTKVEELESC